jgi:hypothetical protein|tara:strand:- start:306 stop:605 length:300 start_codon:yes stop_codon:yes gene_type:complete
MKTPQVKPEWDVAVYTGARKRSKQDSVSTMILQDGTFCLVEPKPDNTRTDHRVFRAGKHGGYDWAHYSDVDTNGVRARWYGWGGKELPKNMTLNSEAAS